MNTSISTAERDAVERWFLTRGLPAVLKPGALLHRVWSRSAPALAALATFATNTSGPGGVAGVTDRRSPATAGGANASLALIVLGAFFGGASTRQHFNVVFAVVCLGVIVASTAPHRRTPAEHDHPGPGLPGAAPRPDARRPRSDADGPEPVPVAQLEGNTT